MVYKGFDVGSAKPKKETLKKYPHKLVDIITAENIYTASNFIFDAKELIDKAHHDKKIPLFVGGSMMYFQSLLKGLDKLPKRNEEYRDQLKKIQSQKGILELFKELELKDPEYASSIQKNDSHRIIRALEIIQGTSRTVSSQLGNIDDDLLKDNHVIQLGIFPTERSLLHKRIDKRLKELLNDGLIEETKKILDTYKIKQDHPALKAINYKQAIKYINNDYKRR
jgi:tRNA dimethylallyltransferase